MIADPYEGAAADVRTEGAGYRGSVRVLPPKFTRLDNENRAAALDQLTDLILAAMRTAAEPGLSPSGSSLSQEAVEETA